MRLPTKRIAVLRLEGFSELDARLAGWKAAQALAHYVAPVGEKDAYVARARAASGPYL